MAAPMIRKMKCKFLNSILRKRCLTFRHYSTVKSSIKDVLQQDIQSDKKLIITEGWLKFLRKQKHISFFHLNDGSCGKSLQVVADPEMCNSLSVGSSVKVEGELVPSSGKSQAVELRATNIQMLGMCKGEDYPFKVKGDHKLDYTRGYQHLRPRTDFNSALLRVRNSASMAIHKHFQENGYIFIHTPVITSNDCEGAGEVFHIQTNKQLESNSDPSNVTRESVDTKKDTDKLTDKDADKDIDKETDQDSDQDPKLFFGHPAYLTVSGQLHLEAITGAFSKAYSFGPTFRAENAFGRRHLSEFYMVEAEIAFTESLDSVMEVIEDLVGTVSEQVVKGNEEDLDFLTSKATYNHSKVVNNLTNKKFERLSYTEAVQLLEKHNDQFKFKVSWGCDLQKEHEVHLVKHCDNTPLFITDFPATLKPFYAKVNPGDETVAAVDLLVPDVGELFGGSLREDNYDKLLSKMNRSGLTKHYEWYLDLRRFGSVPHGGFGMGFERYLQCLCGISNIKDTIPFPRWPRHCAL